MSRTWYASNLGTGDGSSPSSRLRVQAALGRLQPGDTLSLLAGDTCGYLQFPKGIKDVTLTSDSPMAQAQRAIIDAQTGVLFLQAQGNIEVSNLTIIDSTRNPNKPGFVPHAGGMGISFRDCQNATVHLHDCLIQWHEKDVDVESNNEHDLLVERCTIGPSYGNNRPQAIYASGQINAIIRLNTIVYSGWCPGNYNGQPFAPANNNQNHTIYFHWDAQNPGGPVQILNNRFFYACAAGPTSNTGGIIDGNLIVDCSQCGDGIAAWGSRDYTKFVNNTVVGGFYNAISKSAVVNDNRFAGGGPFAVNVDVPAGMVGWRTAANTIECQRNLGLGYSSDIVRLLNYLPAKIIKQLNFPVPTDPGLAQQLRQMAQQVAQQVMAGNMAA